MDPKLHLYKELEEYLIFKIYQYVINIDIFFLGKQYNLTRRGRLENQGKIKRL